MECAISTSGSLLLRKCGLKFVFVPNRHDTISVTSLAEVWIEIFGVYCLAAKKTVTSLAEVWIEIAVTKAVTLTA